MSENPEIVELMTAKSKFDAQVIAGVLREAEIPVYIKGRATNNLEALTEALLNLDRVELKVPVELLERAKIVLLEAEASAKLLDDPAFDPGEPDPSEA